MPCFNPYYRKINTGAIHSLDVSQSIPCPCGHCPYCRYRMSRTWVLRLKLEAMQWQKSCFLTLTYNDENLKDRSLHPEHLTDFWKRLRYYVSLKYGSSCRIKYFSCGEYGDKFGRPHYHALIFGLDAGDNDIILKAWTFGFIQNGSLTENSIKYVAGYALKKLGKDKDRFRRSKKWPEFIRASQGIGVHIVSKLPHFTPVIYFDGRPEFLGRYLTKKLAERFYPYSDLITHRNPVFQLALEEYITKLEDMMWKWHKEYDNLDKLNKSRYSLLRFSYEKDTIQFKRDFLSRYKLNSRISDEKEQVQSFAYC